MNNLRKTLAGRTHLPIVAAATTGARPMTWIIFRKAALKDGGGSSADDQQSAETVACGSANGRAFVPTRISESASFTGPTGKFRYNAPS